MAKTRKPDKSWFRIIGDVHGKFDRYAHLTAEAEYSLQVGDMGFNYSYLTRIVDAARHKVIGGNHDNYTRGHCTQCPEILGGCNACQGRGFLFTEQSAHFLGDFGVHTVPHFGQLFFVRGAWSIDWQDRTEGVSWWRDEELNQRQSAAALEMYKAVRPDLVVTHTAPFFLCPHIPFKRIFGPEIHRKPTETLLEEMFHHHQPKMWIFGHWHVNWEYTYYYPPTARETTFICLNELAYKDFPKGDNQYGLHPEEADQADQQGVQGVTS